MGQKSEILIKGPFLGLNTMKDASLLDPREASDCDNVILDGDSIVRRKGITFPSFVNPVAVNFSDAFTRADNASLGANWTETESNATFEISSNTCKASTSTGTSLATAIITTAVTANQNVSIDLSTNNAASNISLLAIIVRATDASNYYFVQFGTAGASSIIIGKRVAGVDTTLFTDDAGILNDITTTAKTCRVVIVNTDIYVYLDGAFVYHLQDSSLTTGNLCGLRIDTFSSGHFFTIDNFSAKAFSRILGMYSFSNSSGTLFNVYKSDNALYTTDWFNDATSIGTTLKAGTVPNFAVANNRLYIADGVTTPQASDGANMFNVKLAAPTAAPTLALGTSTGLTGEYDYKYTYYADAWGLESPASPVSAKVNPDGKSVTVTMVVSSDARSDKHRIYRRKVSNGETKWSLIEEIAEGTSYTDDNVDEDVDTDRSAPLSSTAVLPAFEHCKFYNNRMFWAGGASNKDRLYFSEPDRPGTVLDENENWIRIGAEDESSPITGLSALLNGLVIFKRDAIWVLSGDGPENFFVQKVVDGIGCIGHGSIVNVENYVYFAAEFGLYRFNLSEVEELSGDISSRWNERIKQADRFIVAAAHPEDGFVIWSYWGEDEYENNSQFVYFYRYSMRVGKHVWSSWSTPVGTATSAFHFGRTKRVDDTPRYSELMIGGEIAAGGAGRPYYYGANTGALASFSWTTPKIDFGNSMRMKHWGEIAVVTGAKVTMSSENLTLGYFRDADASATTAGTTATGTDGDIVAREKISRRSRHLRIQVSSTSATNFNTGFRINSIMVNGVILGRANG